MEKEDFRTLDEAVRASYRKKAVGLIKKGARKGEVAKLFGVNKNTVSDWWKGYQERGMAGLRSKKKGVRPEGKKLLSKAQEKEVQAMILDKMPDQIKLDFALWTRKAVKELVEREFGVVLAVNTMGDYLRSWGFTPQKPKKKAYEQRPKEVGEWLETKYPAIKERARREGAEIHWGDETGVRNNCQHGRSYAPKGRTPVKKSMAKRFSVNMVSTVTNQGKVQFMVYSDNMDSQRFIRFLEQLVKGSKKKVFLVLDNLRVHHSKLVKEWADDNKDDIELFFLPAYSPEKNPDEYLNCDLKQGMSARPSPKDIDRLRENVQDHMDMLNGAPERVMRYFRHPEIQYAA